MNGTSSHFVKAAQAGCCFYETCHCLFLLQLIPFMCLSSTEVTACFIKSCYSTSYSNQLRKWFTNSKEETQNEKEGKKI